MRFLKEAAIFVEAAMAGAAGAVAEPKDAGIVGAGAGGAGASALAAGGSGAVALAGALPLWRRSRTSLCAPLRV